MDSAWIVVSYGSGKYCCNTNEVTGQIFAMVCDGCCVSIFVLILDQAHIPRHATLPEHTQTFLRL